MIKKIKLHNYLNGFVFSMIEFLVLILILMPFMIYYFLHGRLLYGMISFGIVLNAAVIVGFAVNSLIKKEEDLGLRKLFNREIRNKVHEKYPNLQNDTYILTFAILLPFALCLFCLVDVIKTRNNGL
jgi:hypothetical protein